MDKSSSDIKKEHVEKLKLVFPEIITEEKIDFEKLKATLGENVDLGERYGLAWKGKNDVFRVIQETTTKTLKAVREESVDFDTSDNMFIEGDNLETLKVLQRAYYGKIKMIYIDPPYNTGNDFVYRDKRSQTKLSYEQEAGIRDVEGYIKEVTGLQKNTKDSGHYHSNWLNMMFPRLYLARNLLRQDGVIFVSIDDNEVHNLRMIMNEIFGEENFVAQIIWQRAYAPVNMNKYFSVNHDYILAFCKDSNAFNMSKLPRTDKQNRDYKNLDNDPRGPWKVGNPSVGPAVEKNIYEIILPSGRKVLPPKGRSWLYSKEKYKQLVKENRIYFGAKGDSIWAPKIYLSEVSQTITPLTLWEYSEVGHSQDATKELKKLFDDADFFDYPKPVSLMKRIIRLGTTHEDDIILDFFAGSGTTAHAVMQLNAEDGGNRKWIMVQLAEETDEDSEARKSGYNNIAEIAKERVRRAAKKIAEEHNDTIAAWEIGLDLGFKAFKLEETNFKIWNSNIKDVQQLHKQMEAMLDVVKKGAKEEDLLFELLLKSGIEPTTKKEKKEIEGLGYWRIGEGELIICLAKEMSEKLFSAILAEGPKKIIVLDSSFGSDELKVNLLLQADREEIEILVL